MILILISIRSSDWLVYVNFFTVSESGIFTSIMPSYSAFSVKVCSLNIMWPFITLKQNRNSNNRLSNYQFSHLSFVVHFWRLNYTSRRGTGYHFGIRCSGSSLNPALSSLHISNLIFKCTSSTLREIKKTLIDGRCNLEIIVELYTSIELSSRYTPNARCSIRSWEFDLPGTVYLI